MSFTYRTRRELVTACQWRCNGDHDQDATRLIYNGDDPPFRSEGAVVRRFRHPDVDGRAICASCGATFHVHGWVDQGERGVVVCPGDFVVTRADGERLAVKPTVFDRQYERWDQPAVGEAA